MVDEMLRFRGTLTRNEGTREDGEGEIQREVEEADKEKTERKEMRKKRLIRRENKKAEIESEGR